MALISPTVDSIGDAALTSSIIDRSITEFQDSNIVTEIGESAMYNCKALKKLVLGAATELGEAAFQGCSALEVVDLHPQVTMTARLFQNCPALKALILRSETLCPMNYTSAINGTQLGNDDEGYIYVPRALLEDYKVAGNWMNYPTKFRAIEDYPEVCSTAGKVWAQSNVATNITFTCVDVVDGLWVAGSEGSGLYYSTDGKTWYRSNNTNGGFGNVSHGNGIWVACSTYGNGLYYSVDGKTWKSSNVTSGSFGGAYYANGRWVANASYPGGIYYSADGMTWTEAETSVLATKLLYEEGIWVAAGTTGLYYSLDGITWTQSNVTSSARYVSYAEGLWIAAYKAALYKSTDGITWESVAVSMSIGGGPVFGDGVWVIPATTGLFWSEDGNTWTQGDLGGNFSSAFYFDGLFVAGGISSTGFVYSTNGKEWLQSNVTGSVKLKAADFYDGLFVGAGSGLWYSE